MNRRHFLTLAPAVVAGCKSHFGFPVDGLDASSYGASVAPEGATTASTYVGSSSPWGVASSYARSLHPGWLEEIGGTGISWLRGFSTDNVERSLEAAESAGFRVSGILKLGVSFPVDDLDAWENHVASLVRATAGRVRHWEVWNEPPNYSVSKSPEDYAALVVRAHDTVKRVDPAARVGICAASVHLQFMERAILAGAKDHFDYVTLHPYETLTLLDDGFEPLFLSIVPTVRRMLRRSNPSRSRVPVVFSELGLPVSGNRTEEGQANALIKAYVLSLVQGVARVHWFEGVDGDSGPFGLIAADGSRRPSYAAARNLIAQLGESPRALGWFEVAGRPQVFLFEGKGEAVLVGWAGPEGESVFDFGAEVRLIDPRSGESVRASTWRLGRAPVMATGLSSALVDGARANRFRPVPWNGDFSDAAEVVFEAPDSSRGLHPLTESSIVAFEEEPGRDQRTEAAHRFAVDPNFNSYHTVPLRITAEVRRTGHGPAGFNVKYESLDGTRSTGSWTTVPPGDGWHSLHWDIYDARLVGRWGYHLALDSDSLEHSHYALRRLAIRKLPDGKRGLGD